MDFQYEVRRTEKKAKEGEWPVGLGVGSKDQQKRRQMYYFDNLYTFRAPTPSSARLKSIIQKSPNFLLYKNANQNQSSINNSWRRKNICCNSPITSKTASVAQSTSFKVKFDQHTAWVRNESPSFCKSQVRSMREVYKLNKRGLSDLNQGTMTVHKRYKRSASECQSCVVNNDSIDMQVRDVQTSN